MRRAGIVGISVLVLAGMLWGATPSENKGRRGQYQVKTTHEGYNYYVYVPKCYSDDNPAGIHLHFHGQSSQGTAPQFDVWAKYFLEPYDLIGINMQYMDGDNMKDVAGKVAAAVEAITQVSADYKIIHGRGVICSFSGGAIPHSIMAEKYGKAGVKAGTWPFSHSAAYDSDMNWSAKNWAPMSWFFSLGTGEWEMGGPHLGVVLPSRAQEVLEEAVAGRCPDIYLKITKGKGHDMTEEDRAESARIFHRSDLACCAFLYEADFAGAEIEPVVRKANRLDLGGAATDVKRLLASPTLKPELKPKAELVRDAIEKRVDAIFAVSKELAADDPLLWGYYGKIFAKQLVGHPRAAEFKKIAGSKDKKLDPDWALGVFAKDLKHFFTSTGGLVPAAEETLKKVQSAAGEKSSLGRMATEFLKLK